MALSGVGRVQHQRIPITGERVPITVAWRPGGLIVSNMCDTVVKVTSGRGDNWYVPSGRTLRRYLDVTSTQFWANTETEGTAGEVLVVLTEAPLLEMAGADASINSLYRRTVYTQDYQQAAGSGGETFPIPLGGARRVGIRGQAAGNTAGGSAVLTMADDTGIITSVISYLRIPQNNASGYGTPFRLTYGESGRFPMPGSPMFAWALSGSGRVLLRVDVWE